MVILIIKCLRLILLGHKQYNEFNNTNNMKIENIIESCHECRSMRKLQEFGGNTLFVGLCEHINNNDKKFPVVVCASVNKDVFINPIKIPDTCPLEDYKRN